MSDELEAVRALRRAMEANAVHEEQFELDPSPFDPVKKIASILSRSKPLSSLGYFDNDIFERVLFGHRQRYRDHATDTYEQRPIYSVSVTSALEYIGAGIIREPATESELEYRRSLHRHESHPEERPNLDRYRFMKVLAISSEEDVIQRMSFMRIRQAFLENDHDGRGKTAFDKTAKKKVEDLAHSIACSLYEQMVVHAYHKHWGNLSLIGSDLSDSGPLARLEDYEQPDKGLVPLNPYTVMAAHTLYQHVQGFEERLRRVESVFQLILLVGGKFYQERIADAELSQRVHDILNGDLSMRSAFGRTIADYTLATLEGKLK